MRSTSGSYFPLGLNYTSCTATDNAGNSSAPVQIVVLVIGPDETPPDIYYAPDLFVPATDPSGAMVGVTVLVSEDRGPPTLVCSRDSGSVPINPMGSNLFPINPKGASTTVTCTATDQAGNSATKTFTVHVQGAGEQTGDLISTVDSYGLKKLGTSLRDKLARVQSLLAAKKSKQACEELNTFLKEVKTQNGKALYEWQAYELTTKAQQIKNVIGC